MNTIKSIKNIKSEKSSFYCNNCKIGIRAYDIYLRFIENIRDFRITKMTDLKNILEGI